LDASGGGVKRRQKYKGKRKKKMRRPVNSNAGWLVKHDMNKRFLSTGVSALVFLCTFALATFSSGRQQDKSTNSDDDKIFSARDVDKRAVIDKEHYDRNIPSAVGCDGDGLVIITAVLRKSGNVTDVTVVEKGGCPRLRTESN
jgi:hypothetical protein